MIVLSEDGVKLQQLRRRKNLTREALAALAGVSVKTLYTLERSTTAPARIQSRIIRDVSTALGVEPAAIDEFRPSLGLNGDT